MTLILTWLLLGSVGTNLAWAAYSNKPKGWLKGFVLGIGSGPIALVLGVYRLFESCE